MPPVHSIGQACANAASHGPVLQAEYDMQYAGFDVLAARGEPGDVVQATHATITHAISIVLIASF